jgi:hypothetical protein
MRSDLTDDYECRCFTRDVELLASVDHPTLLGFHSKIQNSPQFSPNLCRGVHLRISKNAETKHTRKCYTGLPLEYLFFYLNWVLY